MMTSRPAVPASPVIRVWLGHDLFEVPADVYEQYFSNLHDADACVRLTEWIEMTGHLIEPERVVDASATQ